MDSETECPDCNVKLIHAEYSDDPALYYCTSCEQEFI